MLNFIDSCHPLLLLPGSPDFAPSPFLIHEAIKQGVNKSPSKRPFVIAITRSNLWAPRIVGSLSLTLQENEITIQMLAVNQKVKVTLKGISLLDSRVRQHQCPCSVMRVSAKVLD